MTPSCQTKERQPQLPSWIEIGSYKPSFQDESCLRRSVIGKVAHQVDRFTEHVLEPIGRMQGP